MKRGLSSPSFRSGSPSSLGLPVIQGSKVSLFQPLITTDGPLKQVR